LEVESTAVNQQDALRFIVVDVLYLARQIC